MFADQETILPRSHTITTDNGDIGTHGKVGIIETPHREDGKTFFCPQSSERKTRPLTPTDLEREAALGDRKRGMNEYFTIYAGGADKHFTARKFFLAFMRCALTVTRIPLWLRSTLFCSGHFRQEYFDRDKKSPWCAFHAVQRNTQAFISLVSDSHKEDTKYCDRVQRCMLGNKLHITLNIKKDLRKCITQTQVLLPETHTLYPQDHHQWLGSVGLGLAKLGQQGWRKSD